jgi:hypothetical protein
MTSISVEEQQLDVVRAEDAEIELNLKLVDGVGTSAALNFRNQLLVDRLFLRVEIGDASYRLGQLQNYLAINF